MLTEFIQGFFIFYPLISYYYARVPLNSGWRTTDGTRATI
jgi:hypothetical protein